jgi:anhydro-N-acetylmuramic acid kinase
MVYNVIGIMSGSSLDGLDIAFVQLTEVRGKWEYEIRVAECLPYEPEWVAHLSGATALPAMEYLLLHSRYGHYTGQKVNEFIARHQLDHQVHFIASHGHTTFHVPSEKMTAQLGEGAAIAAVTGLPVISDLRAMDVALGGQGAPIVPVGEQLLLPGYTYYLNLGGIANISARQDEAFVAYDICPANRVLNALAAELGREYDENGALAAGGLTDKPLLEALNALPYYELPWPKSLANEFGTGTVLSLVQRARLSVQGRLNTYTNHIAIQVAKAVEKLQQGQEPQEEQQMLITGGGAFNGFMIKQLQEQLQRLNVKVVIPDEQTIKYKEALIMALIGALRWRQEPNVLSSVTGAQKDSVGGALWQS